MKPDPKIILASLFTTVGTGLLPSVAAGQAILESGNGNSRLTKEANNYFGLKPGSSWKGQTVTMRTKEFVNGSYIDVDSPFRAYSSAIESFQDRNRLLTSLSRYEAVKRTKTAPEQIAAIKAGGYATDPGYVDKVLRVISSYDLLWLDNALIWGTVGGIVLISGIYLIEK